MSMADNIIRDTLALRESSPQYDLSQQNVLITNLIWLQQVITASENLMRVAMENSRNETLTKYLESHFDEERDHAKWLADDLAQVGVTVEDVPMFRSAVELVGVQYYLVFHKNPVALLGYMAVLEGFPFPLDTLEQLEQVHGAPLLRCLRYHAENDIEHRKELFKVIDEINDPVIYENAIRTQHLIDGAFRADK